MGDLVRSTSMGTKEKDDANLTDQWDPPYQFKSVQCSRFQRKSATNEQTDDHHLKQTIEF